MDDLGMDHYSIRLTIDHTDANEDRLKIFVNKYRAFLVTGHSDEAESPHYHIYIKSGLKNQALRKRIKVSFPECIGNKGYSIKQLDEQRLDEHLRYLCRDEVPGVVMSSFEEETIEEYKADYYEKQKEFKKQVKTISKGSTFEIMEFIEANPDLVKFTKGERADGLRTLDQHYDKKIEGYTPREIAIFVFEYYMRKKNMLPSRWIFKGLIDTIYMRAACQNEYEHRRDYLINEYLD